MKEAIEFIKRGSYVLGFIAVLIIALSLLNDLWSFKENYIESKKAEDNLPKINSGVSRKYVEAKFGPPVIERKHKDLKVLVQKYAFKKFYLSVVYDEDESIIYYAVTARSKKFKPIIPYSELNLGSFRFSKNLNSGTIDSTSSAKFYRYSEYTYLAAPGNYKNLYLAYNPAGIDYGEDADFPMPEENDPIAIERFRNTAIPNSYGIGRSNAGEKEIALVKRLGVGIDFYETDIPFESY